MKYKIVIFDIGGTLFDKNISDRVSESVIDDIQLLRKKGIKVGVCSMRIVKYCKEVVPVELDFYISLNGSYVVCDEEIMIDYPMENVWKNEVFLSYGVETAYYSNEIAKEFARKNGFLAQQKGIASPIYNLVLFNINPQDLTKYADYHKEYWPLTKTLMLQRMDASKVSGITNVLQYYHIESPILYFGDGPNDLEVFENYSDCICMGSCYPKLEKYALFKTETCQNKGISKALRRLKIL